MLMQGHDDWSAFCISMLALAVFVCIYVLVLAPAYLVTKLLSSPGALAGFFALLLAAGIIMKFWPI